MPGITEIRTRKGTATLCRRCSGGEGWRRVEKSAKLATWWNSMTSAPVRSDMEVMGQNKILGEGWTLLAGGTGRRGRMGASSSTMAVTAKTMADIHESPDATSARSLVYLMVESFRRISCCFLMNISNVFFSSFSKQERYRLTAFASISDKSFLVNLDNAKRKTDKNKTIW